MGAGFVDIDEYFDEVEVAVAVAVADVAAVNG